MIAGSFTIKRPKGAQCDAIDCHHDKIVTSWRAQEPHMNLDHIAHPQSRHDELHFQLGQLSTNKARTLAMASLSDGYPPIRHTAARALSEMLDTETVEKLIHVLTHNVSAWAGEVPAPTPEVVRAACIALRGVDTAKGLAPSLSDRVTAALSDALEDADADTRYHALETLFHLRIKDETFQRVVGQALEDTDHEIAAVAAQICAARNYQSLRPALETRRSQTRGATRLHFTLSLAELLTNATSSQTEDEQTTRGIIDELAQALKKEETSVAAAKWLGKLGQVLPEGHAQRREVVDILKRQLNRWLIHPHFKIEAAVALLELGDPMGHQHLQQQFKSKRKDVKGYVITVAGTYQLPAFFEPIVAIAQSNDFASETAITALAQYDTQAARRALTQISTTHTDPECRELARALAEHTPQATDGSVDDTTQGLSP